MSPLCCEWREKRVVTRHTRGRPSRHDPHHAKQRKIRATIKHFGSIDTRRVFSRPFHRHFSRSSIRSHLLARRFTFTTIEFLSFCSRPVYSDRKDRRSFVFFQTNFSVESFLLAIVYTGHESSEKTTTGNDCSISREVKISPN